MVRSIRSNKRVLLIDVLLLMLLVEAAAVLLSLNRPVLGTGIISPAENIASPHQSIDIGSGYTLEMNGNSGTIVASLAAQPAYRQLRHHAIEIGAGYTMEMNGTAGKIVAPQLNATATERLDIGAGYILEMYAGYGKIIPPIRPKLDAREVKIDLASGYALILDSQGGEIVKEGSR